MNPYNASSMYKEKSKEEILQQYRDIEDVNAAYERGKTYLHLAAKFADADALKILIDKGARANVFDESMQNTPLHSLADAEEHRYGAGVPEEAMQQCTEILLDAKTSYLRKNVDHVSCLHYAARNAHHGMFKVFAERGLKLDMTDHNGNTPLHYACEWADRAVYDIKQSKESIARYKEEVAKPQVGSMGRIMQEHLDEAEKKLEKSIKKADDYFRCVETMINAGVDREVKNNYDETPLDFAIKSGDKRIAALLKGYLNDPADPLAALKLKSGGMTLHKAVERSDHEAIRAIIALGTSPDEESDIYKYDNTTALGFACRERNLEAIDVLLECGANPNFVNSKGRTAVSYKMGWSSNDKKAVHMLNALLKAGLDIDAFIDDKANTLINGAAADGDYIVAEEALQHGCDLNIANLDGITPLMNICRRDSSHSENLAISFLENGADINAKDKNGNTALMYAAGNREKSLGKSIAEYMFELGKPDTAAVNNEGKSAADIATEKENEELLKYLLSKM